MDKKFYITTPIYYPSGKFHIGTAYTTIMADVIARYYRLNNYDVRFLTGLDEHGQKIQINASEKGITPQEYVDIKAKDAMELWKKLNISNNDFIRTTELRHIETVKKVFNKLYENGDIYKSEYSGEYCIPCESFFTPSQIIDGKCPTCGRELKEIKEETYFFNMKKYEKKLIEFYEQNPKFLKPESKKNEIMNSFIKDGLEDLCISRTTFDWGIKVPIDEKHVIYVWLDALINYISSLGFLSDDEKLFNEYWPANVQIIGKDILRFHAIYWPIFLMALDIALPQKMYVHDFIMMKNDKMSKSKGNVMYPDVIADKYGVDSLRYYMISNGPEKKDVNMSEEDLILGHNKFLVGILGNFVNRNLSFIKKKFDSIVKEANLDEKIIDETKNTYAKIGELIENGDLKSATDEIIEYISLGNKYYDENETWNLAKENIDKFNDVTWTCVYIMANISNLIAPFMPETSQKINKILGIKNNEWKETILLGDLVINELPLLFQRIEKSE